jgi:hypothetical protein
VVYPVRGGWIDQLAGVPTKVGSGRKRGGPDRQKRVRRNHLTKRLAAASSV